MPAATQIFRALVTADTDGAVRELKKFEGQTERSTRTTEKSTKRSEAAFAGLKSAAMVVGPAVAFSLGKQAIDAASDLEESTNAVQVAFGDAATDVLKVGENSAEAFGLARSEFNDFAVRFSGFATQIAGPGGDVAAVVEDLTTRAADFASVMNLDVNEAAAVFMSTLAGETEPIRKFGGDVSALAVEMYALENNLVDSASEMTEAIKVQARYGLLMEETEKTAGDFANTSESLANQQRVLQANLTDTAATIGQDLLPVAAQVAGVLADATKSFQDFDGAVKGVSGGKGTLGTAFDIGTAPLRAINDYNNALLGFVGIGGDANDEAVEFNRTMTNQSRAQFEAATATDTAADATKNHIEKVSDFDRWLESATDKGEHYAEIADRKAEADERAAAWAEKHAEQVANLIDEVDTAMSTMFDYEDATIDLQNAEQDLAGKIDETAQAVMDGELAGDDYAQALREIRQDEIALAEQALATAEAYAENQGAIEGTTEHAALMKEELGRLAERFPRLRDEIGLYISELNRIPTNIHTQVSVTRGAVGTYVPRGGVNVYGAEGGIVNRPTVALIGEAGPEAVVPLHNTPGNGPLPNLSGGGGGLSIGAVNVVAPAGADADEFGRKVREAIVREMRWNGPVDGWAA